MPLESGAGEREAAECERNGYAVVQAHDRAQRAVIERFARDWVRGLIVERAS